MNRGSGRMVEPALSEMKTANGVHGVSGCRRRAAPGRLLVSLLAILCIVLAAPLAAASPASDENGSSEKPVTAKPVDLAGTPAETTAAPSPTVTEQEPAPEATPSPDLPTFALPVSYLDDGGGEELEENVTAEATLSPAATASPEPTPVPTVVEEEEETPIPIPTLEREAPPRPNATMARAHQYYDRELPPGSHRLVSPVATYTPEGNESATPSPVAVPTEGLMVRGVGTLLDRTPEDVVLTRSGVEIASLDWLLNTAMRLGGRHPRAVLEGETFTVTVTVEARNMTLSEDDPAYVVLVPPPGETGVYEITRIGGPASLRDGERGVWEFSVATRTGRLTLADLTLPEERLVTNLTGNPDLFAFRAYAFVAGQDIPSTGLSDPVLSIRLDGEAGAADDRPLPEVYAIAGIENSTLLSSETMTGAWQRGVGYETIVAGADGHLEAVRGLGLEKIAAIHASEESGGAESSTGSGPSPFDWIARFFGGLFGWISGATDGTSGA